MSSFQLTSFNPAKKYAEFHFFVLNKGLNSGKPPLEPCPNCFVCQYSKDNNKEALYWIFFALWQSNKFRFHLIGSVILYMRKKEMLKLVKSAILKNENRPEVLNTAVLMLQALESNMNKYQHLTMKLKQLKYSVVKDIL